MNTDKTTSEGASEGSSASHAERLRETIFSCAAGSPGFLKSFPPFLQKLLFVGRMDNFSDPKQGPSNKMSNFRPGSLT